MFVLAHSTMDEADGAEAPNITFHTCINDAERQLRELEGRNDLESDEDTRIEVEEVDGHIKYRFYDTGALHNMEEQLWAVATIAPVP